MRDATVEYERWRAERRRILRDSPEREVEIPSTPPAEEYSDDDHDVGLGGETGRDMNLDV